MASAPAQGADPGPAVRDDMPLVAAFEAAWAAVAGDGGSDGGGAVAALPLLARCEDLVARAGLFSANEDADDLVTGQLRYLLVPFLRAEALHGAPPPGQRGAAGAAARAAQLSAASEAYAAFLQRAAQYGFLRGAARAAYDAEESGAPLDPGAARHGKIERFKRSRAVAGLIASMRRARARRRRRGARPPQQPPQPPPPGGAQRACAAARRRAQAGTEGGPPGGVGGWDEEDERLLWTLEIEAAAIKALEARPLLAQELALLRHALQQQPSGEQEQQQQQQQQQQQRQRGGGGQQPDQQQRAALQAQMFDRLSGIAGQLTLGEQRATLRQQVFRPSHILPTLTVEQQGAIELAEARAREAATREAEAARAAAAAGRRSDDEDEEELARTRAMDDWKDDNPRGWGNSKLRPCA
ncbi:TAP46 [Scenedesmus sp. PABB004]|nr:TAP46 [Scenedesmus sp. PABB004]